MQIGEVRVAEDADFEKLKSLCDINDGWKCEYKKGDISVYTKSNDVSDFKMFKVRAEFKNVNAATLYDVLHDPFYRKTWDSSMIEGYEMCCLNPNNDIGYFALKCPSPIKNRDFVIQRSWLDTGKEYLIYNHSVNHEKIPVRKGFVRGISHLTGYVIRPLGERSCQLNYVTQSDPRGKFPVWLVNKTSTLIIPRMIKKMYKASLNYNSWKSKHNPGHKPWLFPEQIDLPRLNLHEIKEMPSYDSEESLDESNIAENDLDEKDLPQES